MTTTNHYPCAVLIPLLVLLGVHDPAWSGTGERGELPPAPWRAASASGLVESRSFVHVEGVEWRRVEGGDMLRSHSEVRTGKRGRTTLTRNADVLMVNPNSLVELPIEVVNDGEAPIMQRSGSVLYEIDGSVERVFRVVTPYLVAGVKGTVFLITVENRYAAVTVEEGTVEVSDRSTGETVEVHPGETVIVETELDGEMQVLRDLEAKPTDKVSRDMLKRARHEAELLEAVLEERAQERAALENAEFDQVILLEDGQMVAVVRAA
jgi:hypothetical protein